jgi:hypothetical protein
MLTNSEREWLEKRKNLCIRCPKKNYCRTGKKHNFNTRDCRFWEIYAPSEKLWNHELREDFKDVAEFSARVAAKLATAFCPNDCDNLDADDCAISDCALYAKRSTCRLKHARLAVEEELQ